MKVANMMFNVNILTLADARGAHCATTPPPRNELIFV